MSNINYSDYYTLIENKYQEKNFANSIYLCNMAALNNNKKYFAITTNDIKSSKNNTCLIGDKKLELKRKDDILIDPNAFDDDIKSDKMFKLYYIYNTPEFDKNNCIKRKNLSNCLIKSQISFFNEEIDNKENKIIDINTEKDFINSDVNESTYKNDLNIMKKNKTELYEIEKKNAQMWSEFMTNTESKLNIRRNELNENYTFTNELITDECIQEAKNNKKEVSLTNRQKIIQQQDEFDYKTSLIKKLNILIVILILLFFITIIFYSDTVSNLRKNIESNFKNFSNDLFL
jgi:hypothetical protein